jgi:hypothetical protein
MDFMADRLEDGRRIRLLTVEDVFTRECLAVEVDVALTSACVVSVLERLVVERGLATTEGRNGRSVIRPLRLPYDLRRTAVRNMVRAGVAENVAMSISGHRTRAIFNRYNIASDDDRRDAMVKVAAYVSTLPTTSTVTPLRAVERAHR